MRLDSCALAAMPGRQRAALINSISGFKSANLIGTANAVGRANLAIMSSVVHLGSRPPLLLLVIRPGGEDRHTLTNLLGNRHYSINHVAGDMVDAAHQTAARYAPNIDEFEATGLTTAWWDGFQAPLVAEAQVQLAMKLREHQELAINGTHLIIGEVIQAQFPEKCLNEDGSLDLTAAGTVAVSGLDSYHRCDLIKRMAYAKPDVPPHTLP